MTACAAFGGNGQLCGQKCDPAAWLPVPPTCDDIQTFLPCAGQQPTCSNPTPVGAGNTCEAGCRCPSKAPLWDEVARACVRAIDCHFTGDAGGCMLELPKNYLGLGNAAAKCKEHDQGSRCQTSCMLNTCVAR